MAQARAVGVVMSIRPWWWPFQKRYLVEYRLSPPIGLAFPAGHVEKDESRRKAIWREVPEETGLGMFLGKEIFRGFIHGDCARCGGGHDWSVYEAKGVGKPCRMEPTKHRFVKYMSVRQMQPYIKRGEIDPSWFSHILPALRII